MTPAIPRMTNLFLQLGLGASEAAIADFIQRHQLPAAQEQDHRHHRRPTRHPVAPQQRLQDHPAAVAEREQPDLILLGKQSSDDDNAQTAPMLAALRGW